jgi:hypothetical protein
MPAWYRDHWLSHLSLVRLLTPPSGDPPVKPDAGEDDPEFTTPPEPADVWVWGVRQIAGVLGPMLLAVRWFAVLFVFLKGITWAITQSPNELRDIGIGLAVFVALWLGGYILSRFAAEQDSPDPSLWIFRRPR